MSSSFHFFVENVDFWDECCDEYKTTISEQLVYYFIKDSLLNKPFVIKSKRVKFSDTFVTIVKVKDESSANLGCYIVRRDDDYKIIIDKIIPSYRKKIKLFIEDIDNIYKKPENTFVSFLQKYNVIPVFKE
jgi:hypothetical protein